MLIYLFDYTSNFKPQTGVDVARQTLFDEIDLGLQVSQAAQQLRPPTLIELSELTRQLTPRLSPLGFSFRIDEIRQAFRRREVELAMLESAPGELARLGQSRVRQLRQNIKRRGDAGATAV
jgi:hypothetical protein